MGYRKFTREAYASAASTYVPTRGPATHRAEMQAMKTGKLHELVDPSGYGVVRRSLLRFDQRPDGLYKMTIGCSVPVEIRLDTTGSMGGNVDVALGVLPDTYGLSAQMVPGCDLHMAIGIFGDVQDSFPLCRPQFEMQAEKIVEQLTLMVPERAGGDFPEDPHYGLFGAAYLTAAYINRIGLKRYDFTVSDAPARERLSTDQLKRVFGSSVFDKAAENGHKLPIDESSGYLWTKDVVSDVIKESHAFFLQVGDQRETRQFWVDMFGPERVISLPSVRLLPQVQASIIGLTEGTLDLQSLAGFLEKNGVNARDARDITRSVINIPIGAQAALPNFARRPQAGDVFREKTDLWPMDPSEVPALSEATGEEPEVEAGPEWL